MGELLKLCDMRLAGMEQTKRRMQPRDGIGKWHRVIRRRTSDDGALEDVQLQRAAIASPSA
jgi:hypothetical protein